LNVTSHLGSEFAAFPVVADPSEISWRPDDMVLLTMKCNDSDAALKSLVSAGVYAQPIICGQNGVANEQLALRFFPNVFGMVVMMPAQYTEPGLVVAHGFPKLGLLDLGRYPSGDDAWVAALTAALCAAEFVCTPTSTVMRG
jgi:2-dehydropantoate 2-reductase